MTVGGASAADGTRIERFLAHLDEMTGGTEPRFLPVESTKPGLKGLTVMSYENLPEPGMLTAVTYGVSVAQHPAWEFGKPELCISVRSTDELWARALGFISEQLRERLPVLLRRHTQLR